MTEPKRVLTINASCNPEHMKGRMKHVAGSRSDEMNNKIIADVYESFWENNVTRELDEEIYVAQKTTHARASSITLADMAPKDVIEGMLAAQMIAAHNATMECYRRAMLSNQTLEGRAMNLSHAAKLSRTYAVLIDTLNKHRGKGQQKVTVEHVHVHSGGQAVVGVVEGGGVKTRKESQSYGKQITNAPIAAMRSQDETGDVLPVAGDA